MLITTIHKKKAVTKPKNTHAQHFSPFHTRDGLLIKREACQAGGVFLTSFMQIACR
jgi:hypothetical protein